MIKYYLLLPILVWGGYKIVKFEKSLENDKGNTRYEQAANYEHHYSHQKLVKPVSIFNYSNHPSL